VKDKKLVLIGAGELAEIAYEYFTYDSEFEVVAFSVNREYRNENTIHGLPVIDFENLEKEYSPDEYFAFVAVPATKLNRVRTRLYDEAKKKGYRLATYISSHAFVWRNAKIGDNCFIFEDNTIQPFVEIGNNVILWSGNHIGHRTVIEDNCFITSHAVISGYCKIGRGSFVGVNATFNDNTAVPENCIVGSGAVITKPMKEVAAIYVGSPAKQLPKKDAFSVTL